MSLREEPPVETITGFLVLAIFSIRIQSLQSELAILRMGMPSSQQKSTERLVERGRHGDATGFADGLHHSLAIIRMHGGACRGFLDVADVVAVAEVLVDEAVHIAQLQLDGGADVVEAHHLRVVS